jgi:CPA2 family monovalent cation:H+ antiporter-2
MAASDFIPGLDPLLTLAEGEPAAHGIGLLQDLTVILLVAAAATVLFHRIKQPVVLGYILAGLIVGPHTPNVVMVHDEETIRTLGELGMILLMFGLGLHFSLRDLARVGPTAFIAAIVEIVVMSLIGYEIGRLFGWSNMDSIFLGAILSVSSTTIIIKALQDLGMTKHKFAPVVFGILIVEDIFSIAILALLSGIAMTGTMQVSTVGRTLGYLAVFLAVVLVLGLLLVPPLLRHVARYKNDEVLIITALGLCFGVSLLAAKLGYSVALGAFLIGAIIAEAREKGLVDRLTSPVRDMFSAIFFVTVGMMIDPALLAEYWQEIIVITIVVIVGKILTCGLGTFIAGHDRGTSLRVGMAVSQIGEFSFIIAQLGLTLGVTSKFVYPIAVMVSGVTTLTTPYLIRSSDPMVAAFERTAPRQVVSAMDFYTRWVERFAQAGGGARHHARRLLRRWALQIALNMTLLTGFFIVAAAVAKYALHRIPDIPSWIGGPKAAVWLAAVLLALPLLIASIRKLRVAAHLMAEMAVREGADPHVARARRVTAHAILFVGGAALVGWVLLVSSAIMPPLPGLIAMTVVVIGVAAVMWKSFIRGYAAAQISLTETLSRPPEDHHGEPSAERAALGPILEGAILETRLIAPESPAAGKLIRELQVRTRTGASVVGIQRNGSNIINPGPDEEFKPGDKVLLLGGRPQLDAARNLLETGEATARDGPAPAPAA